MRILQISTHTTTRPRHGGQLRSHHIGRVLEANGFTLARLAVSSRPVGEPDDPRERVIDISRSPFFPDNVQSGPQEFYDLFVLRTLLADRQMLQRLQSMVLNTSPDIIMLEHPWLWPALVKTGSIQRTPIIYNAQNLEAALRRTMFADRSNANVLSLVAEVEALEKNLVRNAAATTACSTSDASELIALGARRVVVARNGADPPKRDHLVGCLPMALSVHNSYALFVGSSYLPNLVGLQQFVTPLLKYLRPLHRIVVAGMVGEPFTRWLAEQNLSALVKDRLVVTGEIGQTCLDSLIVNASAILLPIPYGSGSNVKTPEALLSGRAIVATSQAMRGYEEFMDVPALTVADDPPQFEKAVLTALEGSGAVSRDGAAMRNLLWSQALAPIVDLLHDTAGLEDVVSG